VVPDLVTTAKGIAGGLPLAAVTGRAEIMDSVHKGGLGGTYGGNPLACAAALYLQQAIDDRKLLSQCQQTGAYLNSALLRLAERRRPRAKGARGRGLLQGLVLEGDAGPIIAKARDRGLLVSVAGGNVVRFAPPLIVSRAEIDEALTIMDAVLAEG
jgi:4-aminobutyrate aminotransferase-like enzyme